MAHRYVHMFSINKNIEYKPTYNASILYTDITYNTGGISNVNDSCYHPVSEEILTTLKGQYLEKLVHTCSSDSGIGSYQKLFVIMKQLNTTITNSNYDVLLVEVIKLLTSLIQKSQSQYVELLLFRRKLENAENIINIKQEEINNLEAQLKQCLGENEIQPNGSLLGGDASLTGTTIPNKIIFIMHLDIVRAWYYYLYGEADDCSILDPNKVISVFSYLSNNFNNLEEAKQALRNLVENN